MTDQARGNYHHGDLRGALLDAAQQMLEAGEPFSLRAVARRAGVSSAAPYRHFADREALESALAVAGMQDLLAALSEDASEHPEHRLADLAVRYVRFALQRPALFHLMFGRECDDQDDARVQAAAALHDHLEAVIAGAYPDTDAAALATAGWAMAHGLAFLHLDGKLASSDRDVVDARVRAAFGAVVPAVSTHESRPT